MIPAYSPLEQLLILRTGVDNRLLDTGMAQELGQPVDIHPFLVQMGSSCGADVPSPPETGRRISGWSRASAYKVIASLAEFVQLKLPQLAGFLFSNPHGPCNGHSVEFKDVFHSQGQQVTHP